MKSVKYIDVFDYNFFGNDFETNQYKILEYLLPHKTSLDNKHLYPAYHVTKSIHDGFSAIDAGFSNIRAQFPKTLISSKDLRLRYQEDIEDNEQTNHILETLEWGLPIIYNMSNQADEIYQHIRQNIKIDPIGLLSSYEDEGYAFITNMDDHVIDMLYYQKSFYSDGNNHRSNVRFNRIENIDPIPLKNNLLTKTLVSAKTELTKKHGVLPNPSAFFIDVQDNIRSVSYRDTILPIAKHILTERICA